MNFFSELADPLVALTRKGVPFVWADEQQTAFDALKACLLSAPILGFPTEEDRFVLDTDASLFAIGGVLSQIQNEEEVVIAYASRSLRVSQCRYCTTCRKMLAADPLVALTRKGVPFVWADEQQTAFDALKACLLSAPILGFPTEEDRFVLDTDASLFAIGGVLSQIQNEEEVVIAYASRSLRVSQCRYCTTCRKMLAADPLVALTRKGVPFVWAMNNRRHLMHLRLVC